MENIYELRIKQLEDELAEAKERREKDIKIINQYGSYVNELLTSSRESAKKISELEMDLQTEKACHDVTKLTCKIQEETIANLNAVISAKNRTYVPRHAKSQR